MEEGASLEVNQWQVSDWFIQFPTPDNDELEAKMAELAQLDERDAR